ncbi:hypothetical protein ZWY2020_028245 [Hordeum vulgare]|nr:hypothetical protein ZWY2020_028245 [Hordeum vulgare]
MAARSRRVPLRENEDFNQVSCTDGGVTNGVVKEVPCTGGCDMDGEWILTSELIFGTKKPVFRVCNEGFDSGRRFMSCPYEGLNSCGYLRWKDDAWQGRSRMVIQKLADDNKKMQIVVFEKERGIHRIKKERNKSNEQRKSMENRFVCSGCC